MKVVINTSPLVALDRIGQLIILPKLFSELIRPQSVVDELRAGRATYGGSEELYNAPWLKTVDDPPEKVLRKELGDGETAVIALAIRIKAVLVILDDLPARNVAAELGLNLTGTLGLLLAAYRKGILRDLEEAVSALKESGFRISDNIIQSMLNQL